MEAVSGMCQPRCDMAGGGGSEAAAPSSSVAFGGGLGAAEAIVRMGTSLMEQEAGGEGRREGWVWWLLWLVMASPARCSWHGTARRLQRKIAFLGRARGLWFQGGLGVRMLDAAVEIAGAALWSTAGDGWQSGLCRAGTAGHRHQSRVSHRRLGRVTSSIFRGWR